MGVATSSWRAQRARGVSKVASSATAARAAASRAASTEDGQRESPAGAGAGAGGYCQVLERPPVSPQGRGRRRRTGSGRMAQRTATVRQSLNHNASHQRRCVPIVGRSDEYPKPPVTRLVTRGAGVGHRARVGSRAAWSLRARDLVTAQCVSEAGMVLTAYVGQYILSQ